MGQRNNGEHLEHLRIDEGEEEDGTDPCEEETKEMRSRLRMLLGETD